MPEHAVATHEEWLAARQALLAKEKVFSDDRVMRRLDGELFWVHVRGFTYTPKDPHRNTLWVFTELSNRQPNLRSCSLFNRRQQ